MKSAEIGKRIKEIREKKKLSVRELGEMVKMPYGKVSERENGKRQIQIDEISKFANALGVDEYYLMTGYEKTNSDAVKVTGFSNETINRIRKLSPKERTLLEMLINDDGSVADPDLEPEYGFMEAFSHYVNDPSANRPGIRVPDPDNPHKEKFVFAPLNTEIQLADGTIHKVTEWLPSINSSVRRLKKISKTYLKNRTEFCYSGEEEDDDE